MLSYCFIPHTYTCRFSYILYDEWTNISKYEQKIKQFGDKTSAMA
jgi:hypothetical protein